MSLLFVAMGAVLIVRGGVLFRAEFPDPEAFMGMVAMACGLLSWTCAYFVWKGIA